MDRKTVKKLCRFLKEQKMYAEFVKEFNSQYKIRNKWLEYYNDRFICKYVLNYCTFKYYCETLRYDDEVFYFAFEWSKTKSGSKIWERLHRDWVLLPKN